MRGWARRWLHRLTSDEEELEAEALLTSTQRDGSMQVADCRSGEKVDLQGRLRSVQLCPTDDLATLVAELYDGTESVELIWLGRRSIAGIEAGRTVRVHGRMTLRDGNKAIYNPGYHLMPRSE